MAEDSYLAWWRQIAEEVEQECARLPKLEELSEAAIESLISEMLVMMHQAVELTGDSWPECQPAIEAELRDWRHDAESRACLESLLYWLIYPAGRQNRV